MPYEHKHPTAWANLVHAGGADSWLRERDVSFLIGKGPGESSSSADAPSSDEADTVKVCYWLISYCTTTIHHQAGHISSAPLQRKQENDCCWRVNGTSASVLRLQGYATASMQP